MIQTMLSRQQSIWYLLILELIRYLYAVNYDVITLWRHNMMSLTWSCLIWRHPSKLAGNISARNKPLLHTPLPKSVMSSWQLELSTQNSNIMGFPLIFCFHWERLNTAFERGHGFDQESFAFERAVERVNINKHIFTETVFILYTSTSFRYYGPL